jgi:hypothetical protein
MSEVKKSVFAPFNSDHKFNLDALELVFEGDANWDIYADEKGRLYSVGKPELRGANGRDMDTMYGDKHHIKKLMSQGYFTYKAVTEAGLELMSGLASFIHHDSKDNRFTMLNFA